MEAQTVQELQARLDATTAALHKAEERALAGQFALELMHEIKNPLEALGYLTYLATEEADDSEKVRKYMKIAEEQMSTLRGLASQTLALGRSSQTARLIDLSEIADAALRIHTKRIESKQIHLVKGFGDAAHAHVRPSEILQVLSNLLVNSIDALPANGVLQLRLRKKATGHIEIIVADNGEGIPEHHAQRIFEPFFTTKQESGNGLGLALSKRIIDQHSGRISMRSSVRPGRSGTTFKVVLPA